MQNNPQFPLYIPSKGRFKKRLTIKALELMKVPYTVIVEEQEYKNYVSVINKKNILVLDKNYQKNYDACDNLGETKSKGSGPARNFAWEHSISNNHKWHWIIDDNIAYFARFNRNLRIRCYDGTPFKVMEDFTLRYKNVAMSGPSYLMFVTDRDAPRYPPFTVNTRIYSCNLIKNDIPFRWRGRYNEDTDLSLRILKAGWCTIQFNAFLQHKMATQSMKGGNTDELYKHGTIPKTKMQIQLHPDVSKAVWRFGRVHHYVDYTKFKKENRLILKDNLKINNKPNEYGLTLIKKELKRT